MTSPTPRLLDVAGAAAYLGVKESYVLRLRRERRVPVVKFRRLIRFDVADLDALIDAQKV